MSLPEVVKRIEELLLEHFAFLQKLDVIDHEQVNRPVPVSEGLYLTVLQRIDILVQERFCS